MATSELGRAGYDSRDPRRNGTPVTVTAPDAGITPVPPEMHEAGRSHNFIPQTTPRSATRMALQRPLCPSTAFVRAEVALFNTRIGGKITEAQIERLQALRADALFKLQDKATASAADRLNLLENSSPVLPEHE